MSKEQFIRAYLDCERLLLAWEVDRGREIVLAYRGTKTQFFSLQERREGKIVSLFICITKSMSLSSFWESFQIHSYTLTFCIHAKVKRAPVNEESEFELSLFVSQVKLDRSIGTVVGVRMRYEKTKYLL